MRVGETGTVINVKKACSRILCDGALLTPNVFEFYKTLLTPEELANIETEETVVKYVGHNVITYKNVLLGDDGERNVFHLPNGESVHN